MYTNSLINNHIQAEDVVQNVYLNLWEKRNQLNADNDDIEILINKVKEIIQNLLEKCKLVFELSKKEGLTNVEISEHLNISVKAVEAQITKAFKTLREEFGNRVKAVLF